MAVTTVITDIEGTTTSVSFVYDVLFPYARAEIPGYVRAHVSELSSLLDEVRGVQGDVSLDAEGCIAVLLGWMDDDRKIAPLKTLQGRIWRQGYENGAFTGHLFADVAPCLGRWKARGVGLYVYSSGSVEAQRLLFGHTDEGDLTSLFSGWFDTRVGGKKEASSYARIAGEIGVAPDAILFLSDNPDELSAASRAGCEVMGMERPGNSFVLDGWPAVKSFADVDPLALRNDAG